MLSLFALTSSNSPFFLLIPDAVAWTHQLLQWLLLFSCAAAAAAESLQSCPILCDPIDGSPLGSSVPGILQARILEWVAISFSNAWKWKVKVKSLSRVRLFSIPWTSAYQAPPSMGFSRQEYWSGLPLPSPTHGLYSPWNSPGQNTEVGSLSLLQGIFPTLGSNPGFPHCRWILYQLSHKGSPGILEWGAYRGAYTFSSRSSWPRNQTGVSCTAGRFCTNWAIREGLSYQGLSDSAHMQIRREMFP